MNQILYTQTNKKSGTLDKKTILMIFSIGIILFGLVLVGKGSFAIISDKANSSLDNIPVVTMNQEKNKVKLVVKHSKAIDKILYNWNSDNQEYLLLGKGRTEIEEEIEVPEGENLLTVKITDIDGKTVSYTRQCKSTDEDVTNPEIELLVEGSKVKIVAKDETQIDYIKYYWNNEDETVVNAREDSPKQIEEKLSIMKGENTLTVIAVDKNGNESTKEQTFKGAKKPTVELYREGQDLVVKVKDEEGVQKIEYTLNGTLYSTDPNNTGESLNQKEIEFKQPLASGLNTITLKAYSINGLVEEVTGEVTI